MFSTVSSGMGATVCTAGRFLLVAPLTKLEEEEVEGAASVGPGEKITRRMQHQCSAKLIIIISYLRITFKIEIYWVF